MLSAPIRRSRRSPVVGIPDETWVEAVTAFVVLHAGQAASEAELIAHAHAHLAGYKAPKSVRFVELDPAEPGRQAAPPGAARALLAGKGAARYERPRRARRRRHHHRHRPARAPQRGRFRRPREALREAFDAFEADDEAAVAVLTGAGGHFCAGFDLKAFAEQGADLRSARRGPDGPDPAAACPSRCSPRSRAMRWPAGWSWRFWCDLRDRRRRARPSASSAAAGGCR